MAETGQRYCGDSLHAWRGHQGINVTRHHPGKERFPEDALLRVSSRSPWGGGKQGAVLVDQFSPSQGQLSPAQNRSFV